MKAGKEVCEGYSRRNKRALCSHIVRGGRCNEKRKKDKFSMLMLANDGQKV